MHVNKQTEAQTPMQRRTHARNLIHLHVAPPTNTDTHTHTHKRTRPTAHKRNYNNPRINTVEVKIIIVS